MSGAHTPGPWEFRDLPNGWAIVAVGGVFPDNAICGEESDYDPLWSQEPTPEDARLIAAAPDLLEALHGLVVFGCPACNGDCGSANPPMSSCPMQIANAAISKATATRNSGDEG